MPDKFSKETRSMIMSRIRSKNTKPEQILKEKIKGTRFRYQPKGIPGNPDFAIKKRKVAIFIDGCFWHKCPTCFRKPKSNLCYWEPKIERNVQRAKEVSTTLRNRGWICIRFWEHEVLKSPDSCLNKLKKRLT